MRARKRRAAARPASQVSRPNLNQSAIEVSTCEEVLEQLNKMRFRLDAIRLEHEMSAQSPLPVRSEHSKLVAQYDDVFRGIGIVTQHLR